MLHVVVYDIPDDGRRVKLARALEDFGTRVQYSVFECVLTAEQVGTMMERLQRLVDPARDQVRVYRLCGACEPVIAILGQGKVTRDPEVYVL